MSGILAPAPTGRAKCRGCDQRIAAGTIRFGDVLPNPFAEGDATMTLWYHLPCAAYRRPQALLDLLATTDDLVDDRANLVREAELGVAHHRVTRVHIAERAPSGRAACRACREPIAKGQWRITLLYYEDGRYSPSGSIHCPCASAYFETIDILPRLRYFTPALTSAELQEIAAEIASGPPPAELPPSAPDAPPAST